MSTVSRDYNHQYSNVPISGFEEQKSEEIQSTSVEELTSFFDAQLTIGDGITTATTNMSMPVEHIVESLEEPPAVRTYYEMVKRIPAEDLRAIEKKMDSLENVELVLAEIQKDLEIGDYASLHKDAFYYALRGVREGKVNAKVVLRISDIETLRLQGVSFKVIDPIEECSTPSKLRAFMYKATGKHLHARALDRFIEKVKAMPKEDRFMMVFLPLHQKLKSVSLHLLVASEVNPTISQIVETRQKMNVFNRVRMCGAKRHSRYSASLEIFELFLKERFQEDAVRANPVFGISTLRQIEQNGLTSTRDICHLYIVPDDQGRNRLVTFKEADGFSCEENDFNYHDRYHTFVTSAVGKKDREKAVRIAQKVKGYAVANKERLLPEDYKGYLSLSWQIKDMDFPLFFRFDRNIIPRDPEVALFAKMVREKLASTPELCFSMVLFSLLEDMNNRLNDLLIFHNPSTSQRLKNEIKKYFEKGNQLTTFKTLVELRNAFLIIAKELDLDVDTAKGKQACLSEMLNRVSVFKEEQMKSLQLTPILLGLGRSVDPEKLMGVIQGLESLERILKELLDSSQAKV